MRRDPGLVAASVAFAGACVFGSVVSIRPDLPGEPFGVAIALPVPTGLLIGWGAGVAAPWPMPVAALIAAATAGRAEGSAVPGVVCVGLGIGCIAGALVEPVTYHLRSRTRAVRAAVVVNIMASAALSAAGLRYLRNGRYRR